MFDNYVMMPMGRIVFDFMRPPDDRDPTGVADARMLLNRRHTGGTSFKERTKRPLMVPGTAAKRSNSERLKAGL